MSNDKKFNKTLSLPQIAPEPEKNASEAEIVKPEKRKTIGSVVAELLMDQSLNHEAIVEKVHAQFENSSTSKRSIASVAATLRKNGVNVPMRRKAKAE